jgi:hypothetical protein
VNAMHGRVTGHPGLRQSRSPDPGFRNTAGLSGELSAGDIVCVGEVALAVGRPAGWEPASGPLAEVRTREHGTNPLPLPGRSPGSGSAPDPRKEEPL